ncbi:FHA domain-containing protein [Anabaena azotica]|uniref:FHA domain-containing protein n=1 Tax=Anabaena azotica FACHB-119 TaxID=947527 RepID=A0ABR8CZH1_9NOST|nr:FHA domain-containing protein [Anabaena azotica]MBD2499385.1 FHA domain-containing protein [Anabaena azotica FACHB-119]
MQSSSPAAEISKELVHLQTSTVFALLPNLSLISIGKPNEQKPPDIDVSGLPDADVVSRIHAQIWISGGEYYITDLGSSNGTYVNGVRLQAKVFCTLNPGDTIALGQGDKVTFLFRVKQSSTSATGNAAPNSAPTKITSPTTSPNGEGEVALVSKLIGIGLIIAGVAFFSTSLYVNIYFLSTPGILLGTSGVIALNWGGRDNRILGWVLIGIGIALFIGSGVVVSSVSLIPMLISFAAITCGIQLLRTGKVFNFDPLTFQQGIKK